MRLCSKRCEDAAPSTPRADPSVVRGLRKRKERGRSLRQLQMGFMQHHSNRLQLQEVMERGLLLRQSSVQVANNKPSELNHEIQAGVEATSRNKTVKITYYSD